MTREQIESTLKPDQTLRVDRCQITGKWDAKIVTSNSRQLSGRGRYGDTEQQAIDNLGETLNLTEPKNDVERRLLVLAVTMFLSGVLLGGTIVAEYDKKIVDSYSVAAQ